MNNHHNRHYTALADSLGRIRLSLREHRAERGGISAPLSTSPRKEWTIRRNHRGQDAREIYFFSFVVGAILFSIFAQQFRAAAQITGWHWLWFITALPITFFILLHLILLTSASAGWLIGKCGILPNSPPAERTSFCFLAGLTALAAWAAGTNQWIAIPGIIWLALVTLNLAAALWRARLTAES